MPFIEITKDTFESEVLKSDKPVLADFNADWCGPCQALKPILEELAEEYDVASIPCLVIFKDGAEAARSIGMKSREDLEDLLGEN